MKEYGVKIGFVVVTYIRMGLVVMLTNEIELIDKNFVFGIYPVGSISLFYLTHVNLVRGVLESTLCVVHI